MAEPNWQLLETVLQRVQDGVIRLEGDMTTVKSDIAEIKADMRSSRVQVRYAIGSADLAEHQSAEVQGTTRELKNQLNALTTRVDELEKAR